MQAGNSHQVNGARGFQGIPVGVIQMPSVTDQQRCNQGKLLRLTKPAFYLSRHRLVPGPVLAVPATGKPGLRGNAPDASSGPEAVPEQPVLVAKAGLVQVAVGAVEDDFQA